MNKNRGPSRKSWLGFVNITGSSFEPRPGSVRTSASHGLKKTVVNVSGEGILPMTAEQRKQMIEAARSPSSGMGKAEIGEIPVRSRKPKLFGH